MSDYGLILTDVGAAAIEAAYQAGTVVNIPLVLFGDGGGNPVKTDPTVTQLAGKLGSVPLSAGSVGPVLIGGTGVVPCRDYPGKVLREFGLQSDSGTLIAYGAYPDTYLPNQEDAIVKELIIKFIMPLVHSESVTLVIDPNIATLTVEEADKRYYRRTLHLKEIADEGEEAQAQARINIDVYAKDDVYTRTEADDAFQPKGSYAPAGDYALKGESYTKNESDDKYQPKGSYAPAGDYALKGDSYTKNESDNKYQPKGEAYSKNESDARFIQGIQLGAQVSIGKAGDYSQMYQCPDGCVMTGTYVTDGGGAEAAYTTAYYKPVQKLLNGVWVTILG